VFVGQGNQVLTPPAKIPERTGHDTLEGKKVTNSGRKISLKLHFNAVRNESRELSGELPLFRMDRDHAKLAKMLQGKPGAGIDKDHIFGATAP
jgi:hypothetical protein